MKTIFPLAAFMFLICLASCDSQTDNKDQVLAPSVLPGANPVLPGKSDSLPGLTAGVTLNPKHGQPGHRCDIAEGAPLNTAATNTTVQPNVSPILTPTLTPTVTPTVTPGTDPKKVLPALTPSTTSTGGLNPKHGEPGHRCDIAVGAPLSGKSQ